MSEKTFVKKNIKTYKAKEFAPNTEIIGVIFKYREREVMDKMKGSPTFGELRKVTDLILLHEVEGTIALPIDVGLKLALQDSDAQLGDLIKIVKLNKTELDGGKTVNNYEIFIAE